MSCFPCILPQTSGEVHFFICCWKLFLMAQTVVAIFEQITTIYSLQNKPYYFLWYCTFSSIESSFTDSKEKIRCYYEFQILGLLTSLQISEDMPGFGLIIMKPLWQCHYNNNSIQILSYWKEKRLLLYVVPTYLCNGLLDFGVFGFIHTNVLQLFFISFI